MLRVCKISIEVKLMKGEHDTAIKNYRIKINGRKIYRLWQELYKGLALAGLRNLQIRYTDYRTAKQKEYLNKWPPHSLFCEKRCCQKAFSSYHKFLRQHIKWGSDGHLI